eukprot:729549-Prymnesium_polylepis.1
MLLSSLASATPTPLSSHNGTCLYGGDSTTTVRIRFPPGSGNQDFAWPPLPPAGDAAYDFALDRAVIALAPGCVASEGLVPNAANGPSVAKTLWIGRLTELARPPRLDRCGCGAAILLCGSGGLTGDNLRYVRHLAAEGFSVVAPDTMAAPTGSSYPRTRPAIVDVSAQLAARKTSSYWCANDVYSGGCAGAYEGGAYPACFSSNAANIAYDPAGWVAFYERVFEMRRREADSVVSRFAATFGRPARFFVAGNSEGAMVASRYTHPALAQLGLAGRVLSAWSCEYNCAAALPKPSAGATAAAAQATHPSLPGLRPKIDDTPPAPRRLCELRRTCTHPHRPGGAGAQPPLGKRPLLRRRRLGRRGRRAARRRRLWRVASERQLCRAAASSGAAWRLLSNDAGTRARALTGAPLSKSARAPRPYAVSCRTTGDRRPVALAYRAPP